MRRLLLVLTALLPLACNRLGSANWDDTYTLKMYENQEGDVSRTTLTRTAVCNATATADCRAMTGKGNAKDKEVYTEKVLANHRLRRTYEVDEQTDLKGQDVKSHLAGKTVEIDLSGSKPKYTIDDKPATYEQAKELDLEFARKTKDMPSYAEMLPDRPVKVGEWWTVEKVPMTELVPEVDEVKFAPEKARLRGKLVRVTQMGGRPRATVEFTLNMPIRECSPPGIQALAGARALRADSESAITMTQIVDFWSDASTPDLTALMQYHWRIGADLPNNGLFTFHFDASGTTVVEAVTKK